MDLRHCVRLLLMLLLFSAGCADADAQRVPLVPVRGLVTLDGKPLAKAVVLFESADGSFSYGQTDRRGRYALRFDSRSWGATPGTKTVRISMNRRIHGLNSNDEGGPGDRAGGAFPKQSVELIPERYHARSNVTVEVIPKSKRYDFKLKS